MRPARSVLHVEHLDIDLQGFVETNLNTNQFKVYHKQAVPNNQEIFDTFLLHLVHQ